MAEYLANPACPAEPWLFESGVFIQPARDWPVIEGIGMHCFIKIQLQLFLAIVFDAPASVCRDLVAAGKSLSSATPGLITESVISDAALLPSSCALG